MKIGISFKNMGIQRTGADIVMIEVIKRLQMLDSLNQYYLFFTPPDLSIHAENFHPVPTRSIWLHPALNVLWHQLVLWMYVRSFHLDVMHVPHLRLPISCPCCLIATIHDLAEFRVAGHHTPISRVYRKRLLRLMGKRVDHFITISENSRRDIGELWNVPRERISVVYCGVAEAFRPLDRKQCGLALRDKYGIRQAFILYVGAIEHPNKNLVRLIQAFKLAKQSYGLNHKLVILGMERGDVRPIYDAVQDESLQDEVMFPGYVPLEDLAKFYNAAEAVIYPSLYEGFGLPPIEAMACGTPVGCSNTSSMPEVVGEAAVLFNPYDVNEIATTIGRLVTDDSLRKWLSELGIDKARTYSWEVAARQLLDIYESVQLPNGSMVAGGT